jgi:competence protein ComEC
MLADCTSAWVMPMGILGVIAIPFGFDGIFWRQMDYGIEWMDAIALWVTSLPGAFGRVTSFGTGPLLLATAGLLLIGLLKTPLRWSGVALVVAAIIIAARTPVPDILVAADGRTFAVRGADGKLAIHHTGGDTFATREWLAADADGRDPSDKALGAGIACDPSGCIGMLDDRRLVSYVIAPDAFEEDCRHAAIIVATRDAPPDCDAKVIGRHDWREHGAMALYRNGSGFVIESTRPPNFDRPWAPRAPPRAASAPSQDTARQSAGGHARAVTRLDAAVRGSSGG